MQQGHGMRKTALSILESDPGDQTAAALASFGRTMEARTEKRQKSSPNTDSSD